MLRVCILCMLCTPAFAQQMPSNPNSEMPLEITADETLEWHRNTQQYIARGNAVAQQGNVRIAADILTADYRETSASAFEIYRLTASGNVYISSEGNNAYGDQATYDVDSGMAVMTGNGLKLVSPDQTVTARDSFEYRVTDGKLKAIGNAKVLRGKDKIDADEMAAIFKDNKQTGKRTLEKLEAIGNVIIRTPTETLTGSRGQYLASTNVAEITGDVKITRGPNVLQGEKAEVNLTTNVSRMHGSASEGGRVKGTFYPNSEKKGKPQPQTAPATPPQRILQPAPVEQNAVPPRQGLMTAP